MLAAPVTDGAFPHSAPARGEEVLLDPPRPPAPRSPLRGERRAPGPTFGGVVRGKQARNRAVHGDIVIVEMVDEDGKTSAGCSMPSSLSLLSQRSDAEWFKELIDKEGSDQSAEQSNLHHWQTYITGNNVRLSDFITRSYSISEHE